MSSGEVGSVSREPPPSLASPSVSARSLPRVQIPAPDRAPSGQAPPFGGSPLGAQGLPQLQQGGGGKQGLQRRGSGNAGELYFLPVYVLGTPCMSGCGHVRGEGGVSRGINVGKIVVHKTSLV